jgi:hypothetical protein
LSIPSAEFQIQFLTYLQQLLDEGEFVASYKFALLLALADLSVEKGADNDEELRLPLDDIAIKFVGYYWRQTRPFVGLAENALPGELRQNTGRQARVVNVVRDAAARYEYKPRHIDPADQEFHGLVRDVAKTIKVMPLWKLQTIDGQPAEFLYPNQDAGNAIILNRSIAYCFRHFNGFVRRLAQDGWIGFIRSCKANRELLGEGIDLGEFLFGGERASLVAYRGILSKIQSDRCFYCGGHMHAKEVDHFIPWSRYPTDLGHNFVLACKPCNGAKRDLLPGRRHVERWVERNHDCRSQLESHFDDQDLPHDLEGSEAIGRWAYRHTAMAGGHGWVEGKLLERIDQQCADYIGSHSASR